MSIVNALHVLLGAGLVAFGVLAHAAYTVMARNTREADLPDDSWEDYEWRPAAMPARPAVVRKVAKTTEPIADTVKASPGATERQSIRVIDARVLDQVSPPRKPMRSVTPTSKQDNDPATAAMAKDVTSALIASGYPKATAQAAVSACSAEARTSIQSWTVAALKNARGLS